MKRLLTLTAVAVTSLMLSGQAKAQYNPYGDLYQQWNRQNGFGTSQRNQWNPYNEVNQEYRQQYRGYPTYRQTTRNSWF